MNGKAAYLKYDDIDVSTVLYVFTPDCHWCARNHENIRFVANGTTGRFRFVGVSLTSKDLENYLSHTKMPFQVLHSPQDEVAVLYGLTSTPSTIVISERGKVLHYWRGAYTGELKTEVENFFQVQLPGLVEE